MLMEISKDEHERARLRSRKMAETDRISDLLTAEARGELKGEEKGREKTLKEFEEMLANGVINTEEILKKLRNR